MSTVRDWRKQLIMVTEPTARVDVLRLPELFVVMVNGITVLRVEGDLQVVITDGERPT